MDHTCGYNSLQSMSNPRANAIWMYHVSKGNLGYKSSQMQNYVNKIYKVELGYKSLWMTHEIALKKIRGTMLKQVAFIL